MKEWVLLRTEIPTKLTLRRFNSLHAKSGIICPGNAYANSLASDQAQQNVGLDLRIKLFDNLLLYLQVEEKNIMYYKSFEMSIYSTQKLPRMQRVKEVEAS